MNDDIAGNAGGRRGDRQLHDAAETDDEPRQRDRDQHEG